MAVENADNFSDVSMDDEERDSNWTGNRDIPNPLSQAMRKKAKKRFKSNKLRTTRKLLVKEVKK